MDDVASIETLAESGVEGSLSGRGSELQGAVEVNRISVPQTKTALAVTVQKD
ncbi:MAG: hypothetical protein MUO37_09095 [Methyloceanibacter sp.]|jgi:hypothetical protein|nr:hypothetical protein [Methyloceanibacter sp.]